ncbi:mismatch-specific DNA-glycosylase [Xylanibacillus composti]|uniref:Uracil-DNA glycosylase-like domain-containing protein n=1 Tax=Xylanibacillus composti TaxID=1572762 RepID=A0A8J4M0R5_9BACL|nr:mismatch-specific DNA-glycosylase [Xylanibacillus composti]MDT9725664.1 mismatch-specific DNA-glycosylase [Xylanibacillus composti]GIQ67759.1 hypothetical protein XYCOK13_05830 [Xylanibacillus composti]
MHTAEIPDHLAEDMKLLFIGFNPSLRSGETGHHYANPHNRFWRLLHAAGLTERVHRPEEDGSLSGWYGYGFTNIVSRPTRTAAEITKEEYGEGRELLKQKLIMYKPRFACYVGKGVYEQFSGRKDVSWGLQPAGVVAQVQDYVVPSSSGLVRMSFEAVAAWYNELRQLLQTSDDA